MNVQASKGAALSLKGVSKTFADGTRALSPIDLEIAAGEQIVILGPSGCGKTTLLRLIAGLETGNQGGKIHFDGSDVSHLPIERRNVGMVFQSYALFPNMNVIDNVGYGLRVRGIGRAERQAKAAGMLDMVRLRDLAHRRIDQLSGGQKQRVALARALAVEPRILLLDEPLTALDASLREELRSEIDALLRKLQITSVYVTHDQAEAMVLGDRIVVMEKGGVAQVAGPQDLYFRPATRFVAEFIGSMNTLAGEIREGVFVCPAGTYPVEAPDSASAHIGFRPERVRILHGQVDAKAFRIERIHFVGPTQRVLLKDVASGLTLIADVSNHHELVAGEDVGIDIDPRDILSL